MPFRKRKPENIFQQLQRQSPAFPPQSPATPAPQSQEPFTTAFDQAQERRRKEQLDLKRIHFLKSTARGMNQHESDKLWQEMLGEVGAKEDMITKEVTGAELTQEQQKQSIMEQQIGELVGLGQEDFTQLGRSGEQGFISGMQERWEDLTPQQKLAVGSALAAGGVALAGAGAAVGVAAAAKLAVGGIFSKAAVATTAFKGLGLTKVAAVGGFLYTSMTRKKEADLNSQMNDLRAISRDLVTAVSRGADPNAVREQLIQIEQDMRQKGAELNSAKALSIEDRLIKSDAQTTIRRNVQAIAIRRQIVEQYMLTGDIDELNRLAGAVGLE